jgi:hypothetical protein
LKWEVVTFEKDGGRIFNEYGKWKAAGRSVSMTKRVRGILFQRWRGAGVAEQGCLLSSFTPKG